VTGLTLADLASKSLHELVAAVTVADVMALVGPLGSWLLIVLGWRIVHVTSADRARRSEELAEVTELTKIVRTIGDLAVEYYRESPAVDAKKTEATLVRQLNLLQHRAGLLRNNRADQYDLEDHHWRLRQAVTDDPFASAGRTALEFEAPRILRVWLASDDYVTRLRNEFERANRTRIVSWPRLRQLPGVRRLFARSTKAGGPPRLPPRRPGPAG
jgi:hypothetical protein